MDEEKPCCAAAAARKIKRIVVRGHEVGIAQLDDILARVAARNLENEDDIGRALLKEVRIFNYVPSGQELDYKNAVMAEYARRRVDGN